MTTSDRTSKPQISPSFPMYTPIGAPNTSLLRKGFEDLLIYTEDVSLKAAWERILKRLLSKHIRFNNIVPSGGKDGVKSAFERAQAVKSTVPQVFIVDLDFDQLLAKPMINDQRFVYLGRYSIENFLVDEQTAIHFVNARLDCGEDEAKRQVDFSAFLVSMAREYRTLVVLFAIAQQHKLGTSTKETERTYLDKNAQNGQLDATAVQKYQAHLEKAFQKRGRSGFSNVYQNMDQRLEALYSAALWEIIPGKHLIESLKDYLLSKCPSKSWTWSDFMLTAASECSLAPLVNVRKAVADVMSTFPQYAETAATLLNDEGQQTA